MKKIFLNLSLMLIATATLTISGCTKEDATDDSVSAKDAVAVSNAVDATSNDVDLAAGQANGIAGKTNGSIIFNLLCHSATITDTNSTNKEFVINYNGIYSCSGVTETGTVTVQLTSGAYWTDAGAVLSVTISNLQFTDIATGGTYTVNGAYTITNENGGLLYNLFAGISTATITRRHQTISSNPMTITFSNGAQRTWTFDRTRTFTSISGGLINVSVSTEATNGVAMSGTNRYGNTFTNMILSPVQATNNQNCLWKPWTGQWQHQIANRTTTILFGADINGNAVGTEGNCVSDDGYYITYTNGKRTLTKFVEYWQ